MSSAMPGSSVSSCKVIKNSATGQQVVTDLLAVEEPLEMVVQFGEAHTRREATLAITMRTPGNDLELVTGFLLSEGIVTHPNDILSIKHCISSEREEQHNRVKVQLGTEVPLLLEDHHRHVYVSSSCGVCGKTSMQSVETVCSWTDLDKGPEVDSNLLKSLPGKLRELQIIFNHTGGLHGAALFDKQGDPIYWREDVGRHNALDKVLGAAFFQALCPLDDSILVVSGRISFELVQKAVMAGVRFIAGVGAPSSLAVELAQRFDVTLVGFLSEDRFNVYHGSERIKHHIITAGDEN